MAKSHISRATEIDVKFNLSLYIISSSYKEALESKLDVFCRGLSSEKKDGSSFVNVSSKREIILCEDRIKNKYRGKRVWLKKTSGTSGGRVSVYYDDYFYFEQLFLTVQKVLYKFYSGSGWVGNVVSVMGNVGWGDELFIDPCNIGVAYYRLSFDERNLETVLRFVEKINFLRPRVLIVKPSLFMALEKCVDQLGAIFDFEVDLVVSSGQYLDPVTESLISSRFRCAIYDCYITSESGLVGWRCVSQSKFNVDKSNISKICVGEKGRLLVTTYSNSVIGLVNYDLGDKGEVLSADSLILNEGRVVPVVTNGDGKIIDLSRFDYIAFEIILATDYKIEVFNGFFNIYMDALMDSTKIDGIVSGFLNTTKFKVLPIEEAPFGFNSRYLIR